MVEEIRIPPISVYVILDNGLVKVRARNIETFIDELPEHGGRGEHVTPLESFLAGIASCEIYMYKMILEKMGYKPRALEVKCNGKFELGEGLQSLGIEVRVAGVDRDVAEQAWELVRKYCPLYATIRRAGVEVKERLEVID